MTAPLPKLGIVAGGGTAPRRVIDACRDQGRPYHVIALEGQADAETPTGSPHTWIPLGAVKKFRALIAAEKIEEIVMIGHVRRPSLKELKPDWFAAKFLLRIGFNLLGDDALLRSIGNAIEKECGVRVIGAQNILGGILLSEGPLSARKPNDQSLKDIARGIEVAKLLGQADVGQSVIVQQGLVLGVEAIEGTDALIARCKDLKREGQGGVLIKLSKPQQDPRYDLPTLGPQTIEAAANAGLIGIAAEADKTLIIDSDKVKKLADEKGIFVVGV